MFEILQNETNITKIVFAWYGEKGRGNPIHNNRPCHGFAFHSSGANRYVFSDGKCITVQKNDVIFLPQGTSYKVETDDAEDCFAVNFKTDTPFLYEPFSVSIKNSTAVLELFKTAEHIWALKTAGYMLKCKSLLYEIIYLLQAECNNAYAGRQKKELIDPAVEYIHKNYINSELRISELAEMCNITPEYFRKIFKAIYGASPARYIINLKLQRANELLSSGLYTVTEAMLLSGYTDSSYFSHQFKNKYGYPPQNARRID